MDFLLAGFDVDLCMVFFDRLCSMVDISNLFGLLLILLRSCKGLLLILSISFIYY